MLDPSLDYAKISRTCGAQPWILPLREPLRRNPWIVPLEDWEDFVAAPTPEEMIEPALPFVGDKVDDEAARGRVGE